MGCCNQHCLCSQLPTSPIPQEQRKADAVILLPHISFPLLPLFLWGCWGRLLSAKVCAFGAVTFLNSKGVLVFSLCMIKKCQEHFKTSEMECFFTFFFSIFLSFYFILKCVNLLGKHKKEKEERNIPNCVTVATFGLPRNQTSLHNSSHSTLSCHSCLQTFQADVADLTFIHAVNLWFSLDCIRWTSSLISSCNMSYCISSPWRWSSGNINAVSFTLLQIHGTWRKLKSIRYY